jgi:Na+/H+ antiporter NhaD/arsenite permease-like protein
MLLAEVIFSNLGGASTIIGDPPNIIIANDQDIKKIVNFGNFILHVAPGVVLAIIFCFGYLWYDIE